MHLRQVFASVLAASSLLVLNSVHAGVVTTTGASLITAPSSIVPNTVAIENNTLASVFNELQNVTLLQTASVNATTSGVFNSLASVTPGSIIAAGTLVSSYYLHADPIGSGGTVYTYSGTVTFDADILGVSARNAELLQTNFLGAPGTTYPTTTVNGLDYGDGTLDSFTISLDRRTLSFVLQTWAGADALRVITAGNAVPEPAALGLVFAALGALVLTRRRRVAQV